MFSDQYKKDNDKLTLDDEFIHKLRKNLINEQERLQTLKEEDKLSSETATDTLMNKKHSHISWKHTLPVALTACAALALVVVAPNLLTSSKSNESYDMAASEESTCETSEESAIANDSTDGNEFDTTTESATTTTQEEPEEEMTAEDKSAPMTFDASAEKSDTLDSDSATNDAADAGTLSGAGNQNSGDRSLNLYVINDFIPTDSTELNTLASSFMSFEKGVDYVSLDYAYNGRLILHDYYGMIVYDYENEELLRIVDLPELIGSYETDTESQLTVTVYEGGNYVSLDPNQDGQTGSSICYLYDVQTDTMTPITYNELSSLEQFPADTHLDSETSIFESVLSPDNHSEFASQLSDNKKCILFYQSTESKSIASLSLCLINMDSSDSFQDIQTIPIFGDDAITMVQDSGYTLDGLLQ